MNWRKILLKEKKKTINTFGVKLSQKDKIRIWKNIKKELDKREVERYKNGWR